MRTLIYARYSSALQNSSSIDDQVAACRDRAEREGWTVVDVFTDYAISGAAGTGEGQRPGLNAMLARVEAGGVDQVLADTTSRIARNQGDAHHVRDLLNHHGARLFTLADGEIDPFKGAIKGLLDEQQRRELAHNIKRGQAGTVRDGRLPAGLAYGYRVANRVEGSKVVRGLREIDPDQAAVVRRIFEEIAAGQSSRAVAARLNAEGIPGPRGGVWRASTIHGDRARQNGMLQNRIYVGEVVHNRTSKVTDPRTRKTLIRPNPESEWIREPADELRIVPNDLWRRVQGERESRAGQRIEHARRPRQLLSGLAVCGVCGGGWSIIGGGQWACGRARDGRGCSNNRRIEKRLFEDRVLNGLREKMLDPRAVELYLAEYREERRRVLRETRHVRRQLDEQVKDAAARIERLVAAIERGADIDEVREALAAARAQRAQAERDLAALDSLNVVELLPNLADQYRREVDDLTAALNDPYGRIEAAPRLRSMIERIVVTPNPNGRGVAIRLDGRLNNLLAIAAGKDLDLSQGTVTVERVKGIEPSS